MRHFLDLFDLSRTELTDILDAAERLKRALRRGVRQPKLRGRVLGLIFDKPSLRTRVSFQTAMAQLGGFSLFLSGKEVGLGSRESVPDIARTMSQYVDAMVLRTFSHATLETYAAHSTCPVINGLSDDSHPCQAVADVFTVRELLGDLAGRTVVFVGDGNNVARSLAVCCGKLGVRFVLAAPAGYGFDAAFTERYRAQVPGGEVIQEPDPRRAVQAADVIYTDVWTSMGQEDEHAERVKCFAGHQLNGALLEHAPAHARVMHCLPARRGEEITEEVLDGERSVVFEQAGNRLHVQKAILQWLFEDGRHGKRSLRSRKTPRRPPPR